MKETCVLAADIGGGHISAAVVNLATGALLSGTRVETPIDSKGTGDDILDAWASCLNAALKNAGPVVGIAFAMPGPFDYRSGTARFEASDKYESLRDVVVPHGLEPRLDRSLKMRFINDATAFGIGEARKLAEREAKARRVLAVTLGTGFGSAFLEDGIPITSGDLVPLHGSLWHLPFKDGIFDDFISVRWLRARFAAVRREPVHGVREIAEFAREDARVAEIFLEYGANLGVAVAKWIARFDVQFLIIGGNIGRAYDLFSTPLNAALSAVGADVSIVIAERTDDSAISGAARLFEDEYWKRIRSELPTI